MTVTNTLTPIQSAVNREWTTLAPQLVAFVAAGIPATAIVALLALIGIHVPMTLAVLLSGAAAAIAAYIQKDDLLRESAKALTGKLAAFVLSGLSAATVISVLGAFHVSVPGWVAAALPVVLGLISGYIKSDLATTTPAS
jgi:hypothetical protein